MDILNMLQTIAFVCDADFNDHFRNVFTLTDIINMYNYVEIQKELHNLQ